MNFHPHIHAIVLGGGLDAGNHWKGSGEDFFLPVRVVSRLFRGKYLAELKQLWKDGKLEFHGTAEPYRNHYALQELLDTCYKKNGYPTVRSRSMARNPSSGTLEGTHTGLPSAIIVSNA